MSLKPLFFHSKHKLIITWEFKRSRKSFLILTTIRFQIYVKKLFYYFDHFKNTTTSFQIVLNWISANAISPRKYFSPLFWIWGREKASWGLPDRHRAAEGHVFADIDVVDVFTHALFCFAKKSVRESLEKKFSESVCVSV